MLHVVCLHVVCATLLLPTRACWVVAEKQLANMLLAYMRLLLQGQFRGSIVASMSACHAEEPGSLPGRGVVSLPHALVVFEWLRCERKCARVCKEKEA